MSEIDEGFTQPKTLAELHPIHYKPTNRNTFKYKSTVIYVEICLISS